MAAAVIARRAAALDPRAAADLFRRRLELRRRAAGLRLPRHARAGSGWSRCCCATGSASTSTPMGFNLLSFWGLTLTYLFFQIPLMILIITPALDGLKKRMARGGRRSWAPRRCSTGAWWRCRSCCPSLLGTLCAALRQCLRRGRHRLCADRLVALHRADPALRADPRRRAAATRISAMRWPSA